MRKKKEVQDERERLKKEKERAAIDDQIERIARTKKNLGGNQLNTDVRAEFVKGLMQTR